MLAAVSSTTPDIVFLFAGAGLVLYIASRAAVDALTSAHDPSPGKLAFGHWIPIAWAALLATWAGRPEVGVGLVFATSIAAIGMVLGVLTCISHDTDGPRQRAQAWPFVVPAAILALLAGFSGGLTWWHGLMLMGLGACVMSVWIGPRSERAITGTGRVTITRIGDAPTARDARVHGDAPATQAEWFSGAPTASTAFADIQLAEPARERRIWRLMQLLLAIALAAVGGWLAYRATTIADDHTRVATSGLIAAAVVSPLLVLPILGTGGIAAHHGRLQSATAGVVGLVLLNLCALLPLVIFTHYARQVVLDWDKIQPAVAATTEPVEGAYVFRAVPFPLAVWRVDTALLIVFGLLLIPISLGRLTLRKPEGLALAVVYAVYLVISTALAIRL